jgi:hypothetical protein
MDRTVECGGSRVNCGGSFLEHSGNNANLLLRKLPLLLLDGFAYGGNRFYPIAGVEAWRIELTPASDADANAEPPFCMARL